MLSQYDLVVWGIVGIPCVLSNDTDSHDDDEQHFMHWAHRTGFVAATLGLQI